jgi:monomeric sarcosine oxidase
MDSAILRYIKFHERIGSKGAEVHQTHIAIVGAGIVGLSTAFALLKQGIKRVSLLEQAYIDHPRAASHGPSRLIRHEYGSDYLTTEMVRLSLKRWKSLEQRTRRTLYTPTGILTLGRKNDGFTGASTQTLQELGLMPERLTARMCKERFPQFCTQDYDEFIYNTEAGMLHASTCLQTLRDCIRDLGGTILEKSRVTHVEHESSKQPLRLFLERGEEMTAERIVLATGPWVHHLLGGLRLPVRLTRQHLLYFANLSAATFGLNTFPAFMADDLYGFPIYIDKNGSKTSWLKAASHQFGADTEPDQEPIIDERIIGQTIQTLRRLIPALGKATLAHIDSCIYDVSPDETFIIDYLPTDSRILFATGLSGHGFKFGLLLGEILCSMLRETEPLVPLDRFRLARFAHAVR